MQVRAWDKTIPAMSRWPCDSSQQLEISCAKPPKKQQGWRGLTQGDAQHHPWPRCPRRSTHATFNLLMVYREESRCTHWFPIPVISSEQEKHTHIHTTTVRHRPNDMLLRRGGLAVSVRWCYSILVACVHTLYIQAMIWTQRTGRTNREILKFT